MICNTVTTEMVKENAPDMVYVATGSLPRILSEVPGADYPHVISAIDALLGNKAVGQNVVIIGGGLTGIEIAYDQALSGKNVNVVEVLPQILAKKEDSTPGARSQRESWDFINKTHKEMA